VKNKSRVPQVTTQVGPTVSPGGAAVQRSERSVESMTQLTLRHLEILYAHGSSLYAQSQYSEAFKVFGMLLKIDPSDARFYQAAGSCLQMMGNYKEACISYGTAWVLDCEDPSPLFYLGQCLFKEDKLAEARECFVRYVGTSTEPAGEANRKRAQRYINMILQAGARES
jgi:Flp pilus assembly protein TadD